MSAILTVKFNVGESPPPPAPSNLYDIAIRNVEWFDQPPPDPGSFAILGQGITTWLEIGPAEVEFIKSVKIPSQNVDNSVLFHWASNAGTENGITIYYGNDPARGTWRWGIGLMSSIVGRRQYVAVENFDASKPTQHVLGIPYQANGDYSQWTPDKHPECWLFCPTIYPNGSIGWTSHSIGGVDYIFLMPYFQMGTGFRGSVDAQDFGGWFKTNCFVGPHI